MSFDRHVFGYTHFDITDKDLFKNGNNEARQVIFSDTQTTGGKSNILAPIEVCADVNVPYTVCSTPNAPICNPDCDECAICTAVAVLTYCWTQYIDDGSGGSGGGGTGGSGGGSGGGGNNTPPPCGNTPVATKGSVQEGCQPGWTPTSGGGTTTDPENPCSNTDRSSGATATLQYIQLSSTVALFTPFDPNSTTQPEQYFVVNESNGANVSGSIQNMPTGGGSMQGINSNTVMIVHTHPYGAFPFPSPADFFGLASFGSNFQMHYVIGYDGTKYAMVINNYSQLQAFVAANPGIIDPVTGGFNNTSTFWQQQVNPMGVYLTSQGYSQDEAYLRILAHLMKQAGVTFTKAIAGSNIFKKIGIRQKKDSNGSPMVNANGEPIYENADCL